jgi:hypothetical protein
MLKWGEASPEDRKRFIIASAVSTAIIFVGVILAVVL